MFKELVPILRSRAVLMTVTALDDDQIRVNVVPKKMKDGDHNALEITTINWPKGPRYGCNRLRSVYGCNFGYCESREFWYGSSYLLADAFQGPAGEVNAC